MQYRALETIQHDGERIEPGEIVDLSDNQAAALLESGAITPVHAPFSGNINTPWGNNP